MLNTVTIILEFVNNVLIWVSDLMASRSTGKSPETATFELILSELNILINWLRGLFEAFGNFMNGIKRGWCIFLYPRHYFENIPRDPERSSLRIIWSYC